MLLSLILELFGDLSFVTFILYFKSLIEICQESAERIKSEFEKSKFQCRSKFHTSLKFVEFLRVL